MAVKSGLFQKFFSAGYDIGGDIGSIDSLVISRADLKTPGLENGAMSRVSGLADAQMQMTSFWNVATGRAHDALQGVNGGLWTWVLARELGGAVMNSVMQQLSYSPKRGRDGSMEVGASGAVSAGVPTEDAVNLTPLGKVTHASASSEAGVDQLAGTARGGIVFLQHLARASGTVNYLLEHSTNNSTWTTKGTFALAGGATPDWERLQVLGTVNRYIRATTSGVFTGAQFHMSFRRGLPDDIVNLS